METNILTCGKCAKKNKLSLEEKMKLALKREKRVTYICDQCGEDHKIRDGLRGS